MNKKLIAAIAALAVATPFAGSLPVAHADPAPGFPCDSRYTHVIKVDPQTGNAIEGYGPPGCNVMLPMTGP